MRRLRWIMLVAVSGLFLAADSAEDAVKKERAKLQGTWKITSFEANGGKPFGDEQLAAVTTTIDADGKLKVEANGMTIVEADTKIDPTKKPKTIDFKFTEGQLKGQTALGIYELKDDTLKYCRAAPPSSHPKKAVSTRW
jgi:uncharacterized protein (TIGR03067 family)